MSICKDFSLYPPKKRPFRPISPCDYPQVEVDENEQPQDLSMKSRVRALENILPGKESTRFSPYNLPARSKGLPERDIKPHGLTLMSEVAALVHAKPSILMQTPEKQHINMQEFLQKPYEQAPHQPVIRVALKERPTWVYHPYLSSLTSFNGTPPKHSIFSGSTSPHHQRGGSVSPPGVTESSGSDASPEHGPHKVSCEECGRSYATLAGLSRHKQFNCPKVTPQSFECKFCSKSYTSVGALKMHVRTHTLPCKCHICGKAFSRPWLLQGHIRTHTGEKPFECTQCHRSFADRSNLRAHLQTHAHIKKYACRTCPKTFSRMSLLVKHQNHGCQAAGSPYTVPRVHNTQPQEIVC